LEAAGATLIEGDLLDPSSLARAVQGCSAVIHLAAVADSSDPDINERVNVGGSRSLARACRDANVRRIVNVSSTCAARPLQDAYGETKLRAEREFDLDGLRVTHLRPTMMYGLGSKEFDLFAGIIRRAPRVPIPGDGSSRLRPVFVGDAVELLLRVLDRDEAAGRTYDVAGPETISFNDFIGAVGRAMGRTSKPLHIPASVALFGARILGRLMAHPPINVDQVMAFLQDTEVDIEPARRDFAWDPRPLEEGLAELFGD
jgi:NADH dehydrogenase